mgnify:CR=1 FL=1
MFRLAQKPSAGLLDKMRLRRLPSPEWLKSRNLDGKLLIKNFDFAGGTLRPLALGIRWRGENVKLSFGTASFFPAGESVGALLAGAVDLPLWREGLEYSFDGELQGWPLEEEKPGAQESRKTADFKGKVSLRSLSTDWQEGLVASGTVSSQDWNSSETGAEPEPLKLSFRSSRLTIEGAGAKRRVWKTGASFWPLQLEVEP